jgi:NAD(P)-dependent dehydrogenase (short-subunit alcohol dehydrogenase family)
MAKSQYQEKVALVTGANRGLGLETCRELGKRGYYVILAARDEKKGKAKAEELVKEGYLLPFIASTWMILKILKKPWTGSRKPMAGSMS